MVYNNLSYPEYGVEVQISTFKPENGIVEHHVILHGIHTFSKYDEQLENLHKAYEILLKDKFKDKIIPVFKRYFLSDISNQIGLLQEKLKHCLEPCATSVVQQSPLDGTKVVMWVYLLEGNITIKEKKTVDNGSVFVYTHNNYSHYWVAGCNSVLENSESQTLRIFDNYTEFLLQEGCNITDNCVRTWLFVRDVDVNYAGVVNGRKMNFEKVGLTKETHYIASTGIEGCHSDARVKLLFDSYAVKGIEKEQMTYLYAPTHLNPTHEYGVTFERGVCMEYGDRKQLYISGTASIDNCGNVLHIGDIVAQTHRMWENVEKLLEEQDASFADLAKVIVYLRDIADYPIVKSLFDNHFPDVPTTIVLAPVCRPSWLIEMECIAIKENDNAQFRNL